MDQHASANQGKPAQTKSAPSDQGDALPPVSIPDHQLVRCIGRGSYGEVWLARNIMGVYRAVKIVYRKSFDNQRPFERELSGIRRFEPISRSHKGFIAVLHVGINEEHGYFFYLMELGDDQASGQNVDPDSYSPRTLAKEISVHGRLPVKDALKLGLDLTEALAELHKQGLVHRDIKPSNIIFVNGIPKLADIGLVADVNEARSYVGTEGFIPPEGPGTAQADLFSLGKVLYEASTAMDRHHFPDLPDQFESFPDRDQFLELNDVIVQACNSNIARRYRSAWDMHAHLLVVANGGSVKRLKLLERRLANLKRVAAITALVALVLAAIGYQVYREWQRIYEARQQKVGAYVANGINALESADLLEALPYFAEALDQDKADKNRQTLHRLQFGSVLADCPRVVQMWFIRGEVMSVDFSPDGQHVVVGEFLSGKAEIFELGKDQPIMPQFGHAQRLRSVAYSPDGNFIVTASEDRTACVWRATDGSLVGKLEHPDMVLSAHFSPDGATIVTGCRDKLARVWNWREQKIVPPALAKHTDAVLFAGFSPDGSRIVTTSRDQTARLWNAGDHQPDCAPLRHNIWVYYAAFSPDGQVLATACEDKKAHVWELASHVARPVHPDLAHKDFVHCVQFSPDGRLILTAGLDNTARLWLVDNHQPPKPIAILRHSGRVTHACFDSDGRRILSGCSDGTVRIWDLAGVENLPPPVPYSYSQDGTRFLAATDNGVEVRDAHTGKPLGFPVFPGVAFAQTSLNRDGSFILCSAIYHSNKLAFTRSLSVWDVSAGKTAGPGIIVSNIPATPNAALAPVLSQNGKYLVTFQYERAQVWDVQTGRELSCLIHKGYIDSACFSPGAQQLAICGSTNISVWNPATGRECYAPLTYADALNNTYSISHAEFSPDGSLLFTCQVENSLVKCQARVWNAATGQLKFKLDHGDGVVFASFSPDGSRIVTAGEDSQAIIWNALTGRQFPRALHHEATVQSAAFSPDGKWIVTASNDRTARVWSAETGDPLTPPLRHLKTLADARFLADGHHIVTTDSKGIVRVWELAVDQRPVQDLREIAYLLSGGHAVSAINSSSTKPESLNTIWLRLKSRYPSSFAASPWQIEVWHEFQARDCELEFDWTGQEFHLQRLLAIHPNDPLLVDRLNRAKEHRKKGD